MVDVGAGFGLGAEEEVVEVVAGELEGVGEAGECEEGSDGGPDGGGFHFAVDEAGGHGGEEHAGKDVASFDGEHAAEEEAVDVFAGVAVQKCLHRDLREDFGWLACDDQGDHRGDEGSHGDGGSPGGDGGEESHGDCGGVFFGSRLEGLCGDDDADPEDDCDTGFHRDDGVNEADESCKADDGDDEAVEGRVASAGTESFPAGVSDVDGRWEAGTEECGGDGADAVGSERRGGGVKVTCGFCGFNVLEGADDVEDPHRDDDSEEAEPVGGLGESSPDLLAVEVRELEGGGVEGLFDVVEGHGVFGEPDGESEVCRRKSCLDGCEEPGDEGSSHDGDEAAGEAAEEADASEEGDEDDAHGEHGEDWFLEDLDGERHGDEADGDAGECGEEGGAGGVFADPLGDEGAEEFDESASEAGDESHEPGLLNRLSAFIDRLHDEEEVDEERGSVDAVGEGGDVAASEFFGEAVGLPSVVDVSEEDADGCSGENSPVNEAGCFFRIAEKGVAKRDDQQELDQIVDEQTEKAIEIPFDKQRKMSCHEALSFVSESSQAGAPGPRSCVVGREGARRQP